MGRALWRMCENKKILGFILALGLPLLTMFAVPQTAQAIPCPTPGQDWVDQCSNDPEPTGPVVEELGTTKTVYAGLSSDGRNGVTERLFLFTFPGNAGQVYRIDYQNLQNDNPTPGIEFCVNSTSVWGQGVCEVVQQLDGAQNNNDFYIIASKFDYTYYSHLVVRLKVRQTFFNDNDVQAQFTMHRREFNGWSEVPSVVNPNISVGQSATLRWNSEGYGARKVMFTNYGDYYEDLEDDETSFQTAVFTTAGTKEFNLQFSGPARYGGENAVEETLYVNVTATTCTDASATNNGGPLPCTYPPPVNPATIRVFSNISTSWAISGPYSFSGSGTSGSYSGPAGNYSISASDLANCSKSITPSSSQSVGYDGNIDFTITYSCSTPPPDPVGPPSCTSAGASYPTTTNTTGNFVVRAYGVQHASFIYFPTWTDAGGQDDIVWYTGSPVGGGTWEATIPLGSHPGYGVVNSHVYIGGTDGSWPYFCGTANFTKEQADSVPVGVLDAANCSIIGGWAFDPDTSGSQIAVHLYDGPAGSGTFVMGTETLGYRGDVNGAYGISGNHGFTVYTPNSLKNNAQHTIYAYGINSNPSGTNSWLSPAITFGPCPPPDAFSTLTAQIQTGSGTIVSSNGSAGISCPGDCTEEYTTNSTQYVYATPSNGYTFSGWGGAVCAGGTTSNPCQITMSSDKTISASFAPINPTLTVVVVGSGTATGSGISCPSDCTETYNYGAAVSLSATPGSGHTYTSCTGGCSASMTEDRTITVTFTPNNYTLSTSVVGLGSITSSPTGISCPSDCSQDYSYGTNVSLTPSAGTGYTFSGWSGACSGTGSCLVSMTQARSVTATFTINAYTLTTAVAPAGGGTITASGISCPSDCSENYNYGTNVTLTATGATNYVFSSWSGGYCAGTSSVCVLTMDAAKTATANFTYVPPFNYTLSNPGTLNVIKGSSTTYGSQPITKTLTSGATQAVTITATDMPAGVTVSYDGNRACAPNTTCTSAITFNVAPSAAPGTYGITVTGMPLSKMTQFNLVITGAPIAVACSPSIATAVLGQSVTWSANIVGGVAPLTYSWSGTGIPTNPAPSTPTYTRTYTTTGQKFAQLTVSDSEGVTSTCPASASVYVNFDPTFKEF